MLCKKCNKEIPEIPENLRRGKGKTRYLICLDCKLSHTIPYRTAGEIEFGAGTVTETVTKPVTESITKPVTELTSSLPEDLEREAMSNAGTEGEVDQNINWVIYLEL